MKIYSSLDEIPADAFHQGSAVAIGKFDGVHLGHQALLVRTIEAAKSGGLEPVVLTFENNPLSFLRPESCPPAIMSIDQRLDALERAGIATCVVIPFNAEFASLSAEDFVQQVLMRQLHARYVCVGEGFRFGSHESGNTDLLREMGRQHHFAVDEISAVIDEQLGRISSSLIRTALAQGDIADANRLLGRPHSLRATVSYGDARGRELGFPTANLGGNVEGLRPADGVYAGWATVHGQRHMAAISVGANVTFYPNGEHRVEAFLLDFDAHIYEEKIELQFVARLRSMTAFSDVNLMIERMHQDVSESREHLEAHRIMYFSE